MFGIPALDLHSCQRRRALFRRARAAEFAEVRKKTYRCSAEAPERASRVTVWPVGGSHFGQLLLCSAFRSLSSASPTEKLPGFWRGGKSLNVCSSLRDDRLRRRHDEHALDVPLLVFAGFEHRFLERIGAKIDEKGRPQRNKRLLPDAQAFMLLLEEDHLPLIVAEPREIAVVGPVEERMALGRVRRRGDRAGRSRRDGP